MILVTGASGFLGIHLVRALSGSGAQVRALYYNHPPSDSDAHLKGVQWQRADLLDVYDVEDAMAGITHIYHCAAILSFDPAMQGDMLHFNPESTANLVNQALMQGIDKLVYISSIAALGRPEIQGKEITEEEKWGESKYNSAYGLSKYLAETEVWRGIGEGLNAVIINPGIILGEGDWQKGSSELMKIAWKEFPVYSKGVTAWVDVQDVVRISILLMESDTEAEKYIVSAGNFSFKDVLGMMAKALGRKPARYYANSLTTGLIWRLGAVGRLFGRHTAITRETANNAHGLSYYNSQKLLQSFPGFSYTPVEQTIGRMAQTFLKFIERN